MIFKCSIRHFVRRRRIFLLFSSFIFVSFGFFLRYKTPNVSFESRPVKIVNCSRENLDEIRLNCSGDPAQNYCSNEKNFCQNFLSIYKNLFARTRSVVVQRKLAKGKRLGGENIHEVLNQNENDEYFHFEKNFLQLPCENSLSNFDFGNGHLNGIFSTLTFYKICPEDFLLINETTIAVNRYDYANLYHTITDLYTVYFLSKFFLHQPKNVRILFLDAHPQTTLDVFWSKLFHSFSRLGQMNSSGVVFRELIWSPPQSKSEIDIKRYRRTAPSFFFDFRRDVFQQFQIESKRNRTAMCENLQIFFLLRKNYVAHPRNPSGRISRQLANENQVIEYLKKKFDENPIIHFTAGHFEQIPLEQQLKRISQTDLLVGVHGAGLTHVIFMQPNRTLVELAPPMWRSQVHFELMATMNQLNYHRCSIHDELPSTSQTIFECLQQNIRKMCPSINFNTSKHLSQ